MADKTAKRIAELIKPLRVKPGAKVNLAKNFDPGYKAGFVKKKDGRQLLRTGIALIYWAISRYDSQPRRETWPASAQPSRGPHWFSGRALR